MDAIEKFRPKRMWNRMVALTVAVCFLVMDCPVYAQSLAIPITASEIQTSSEFQLSIPEEIGKVETLIAGQGKTVFHIQEAHGNPEVERNIASILNHLQENFGFELLLLEGNAFDLKPKLLNFFPEDESLTRQVVDDLVDHGVATGPELFFLDSPDIQASGIEDLEAYNQNGADFVSVLRAREQSQEFLNEMEVQIERLTAPYLNKELRNFIKRIETYEDAITPLEDWLTELKNMAKKHLGVDVENPIHQIEWPMLERYFLLQKFQSQMNLKVYSEERNLFLGAIKPYVSDRFEKIKKVLESDAFGTRLPDPETSKLFEGMIQRLPGDFNFEDFPQVNINIGYRIILSELNAGALIHEAEVMIDKIADHLAAEEKEKSIVRLLKDHRLLKRLFKLELTPETYSEVLKRKTSIRPYALIESFSSVNDEGRVRDVVFSRADAIEDLFNKALKFYAGAIKRDEIMLESIENKLASTNAQKVVVITGGFHSGPFKRHFQDRGMNYALITPTMTTISGPEDYVQMMMDSFQSTHRMAERVANGGSVTLHHLSQDWVMQEVTASFRRRGVDRKRVRATRWFQDTLQGPRLEVRDEEELGPEFITDEEYDLKRQAYMANLMAQRESKDGLNDLLFASPQMRDVLLSMTELAGILSRDPEEGWKLRLYLSSPVNREVVRLLVKHLDYKLASIGEPVNFLQIQDRLEQDGQKTLLVMVQAIKDTNAHSPVFLTTGNVPLTTHYDAEHLEKYFVNEKKTLPQPQPGEASITDLWFVYDPGSVLGLVGAHREEGMSPHAKGGIRYINPAGQNGHYSEGRVYTSIYHDPTGAAPTQRGVIVDLFDLVRAQETKNVLSTKFHGAKGEYTYLPGSNDQTAFQKFGSAFIDGGILAHEVPGPDIGMSGEKVQQGIDRARETMWQHLDYEMMYFKLLTSPETPTAETLGFEFRLKPAQLVALREEYNRRFPALMNPLTRYREVLDLIEEVTDVRFLSDRITEMARTLVVRDFFAGVLPETMNVDQNSYEDTQTYTAAFYDQAHEEVVTFPDLAPHHTMYAGYFPRESQNLRDNIHKLLGAIITGGLDSEGAIDHVISAITAKGVDVAYRRVKDYLIKTGKLKEGQKVRLGINGMGDVGGSAAVMITRRGDQVVFANDYHGAIYLQKGFGLVDLQKFNLTPPSERHVIQQLGAINGSIPLDREELFSGNEERPFDILITAATANTVNAANVDGLLASPLLAIAEGGNNTFKLVASILAEAGLPVALGQTANTGGVTASAEEDKAKHAQTVDELTRPKIQQGENTIYAEKSGHVERVYLVRKSGEMQEPLKVGKGYIELTDGRVTKANSAFPDLPMYTHVDIVQSDRPGQGRIAMVNNIWVGDVDETKEHRETFDFTIEGEKRKLVVVNGKVEAANPAITQIDVGEVTVTHPIRDRKYRTYRYVGDTIFAYQTLVLALFEPGNPDRDAVAVQRALSKQLVEKKKEVYLSDAYAERRNAALMELKNSGYIATPEEMMHIVSAQIAREELLSLDMDETGHIMNIDTVNPFTGEPIRVSRDFEISARDEVREAEVAMPAETTGFNTDTVLTLAREFTGSLVPARILSRDSGAAQELVDQIVRENGIVDENDNAQQEMPQYVQDFLVSEDGQLLRDIFMKDHSSESEKLIIQPYVQEDVTKLSSTILFLAAHPNISFTMIAPDDESAAAMRKKLPEHARVLGVQLPSKMKVRAADMSVDKMIRRLSSSADGNVAVIGRAEDAETLRDVGIIKNTLRLVGSEEVQDGEAVLLAATLLDELTYQMTQDVQDADSFVNGRLAEILTKLEALTAILQSA